MTASQKRVILNAAAGTCTAAATTAGALGYLEAAAVLASAATFFLGWANFTKPGDAKPEEAPPTTKPDPPKPTDPA